MYELIKKIYNKWRRLKKRLLRKFKKIVVEKIPVYEGDLLSGRIAVITGGTRGIGKAIAVSFVKNNADHVVITGRNKERVDAAVAEIEKETGRTGIVIGIKMDLSDIENLTKYYDSIIELLDGKHPDILVNNAGIGGGDGGMQFGRCQSDDYDRIMQTNLKGTYFLAQTVATDMVRNKIKGNILNIASSSSLRPAITPYNISKWGIRGLTMGMAKSLIGYGIVVNGLAPGPTATDMVIKDDYDGIELLSSPAGRYQTAEEIANMATVLVSSIGRMIVGDIVYMTGGAGVLTSDDFSYDLQLDEL